VVSDCKRLSVVSTLDIFGDCQSPIRKAYTVRRLMYFFSYFFAKALFAEVIILRHVSKTIAGWFCKEAFRTPMHKLMLAIHGYVFMVFI
jgi:hypothetical protein